MVEGWKDKSEEICLSFEKYKEIFGEYKKEYERLRDQMEIAMNTSSLSSIRNNRLLELDMDCRDAYLYLSKKPIEDYLKSLEENLEDENNLQNENKRWHLIKLSLQVYEILKNISIGHSGPHRTRYMERGEDAIRKLIAGLINPVPETDNIQQHFEDVKSRLTVIIRELRKKEF